MRFFASPSTSVENLTSSSLIHSEIFPHDTYSGDARGRISGDGQSVCYHARMRRVGREWLLKKETDSQTESKLNPRLERQ